MMNLYFVRHAQAGDIKSNYDELSEHGKIQSLKLGEYFYKNNIFFNLIITGTLNRHLQTLNYMNQKLQNDNFNHVILDYLNEISEEQFKMLLFYYLKKDRRIELLYQKLQKQTNTEKTKELYIVLLKHIFENWIFDTKNPDSFREFKKRVLKIYDFLEIESKNKKLKNVLVITSGTPLSIILGSIFQLDDIKSLNWMRYIYNTSVSIIDFKKDNVLKLQPVSINYCPHLDRNEYTLL